MQSAESMVASAPEGEWANLPAVRVLRVELRATIEQRLAPLVTAALHGAMGYALREEACRCDGPGHSRDCTYAALAEPHPPEGAPASITTKAPAPLVFAPERPVDGRTVLVREGERLAVRVTLIGDARRHEQLVLRALEHAGARGLGMGEERPRGIRPSLALEHVTMAPAPLPIPARSVNVCLVSPARIVDDGKMRGALEAKAFLGAVRRRADMLSRLYGGGPLPQISFDDVELSRAATDVLHVRRYSTRQGKRMVWPGVIGRFTLTGDSLLEYARLLAFGSAVQVGKGTTFGFGRFSVEACS